MVPIVEIANKSHTPFSETICEAYKKSAKARGTGISQRSSDFIKQKMEAGEAIIATIDGQFAGFTYINTYEDRDYVAHSGLIVNPDYRGLGLSKKIKHAVFDLSRKKFPDAAIFGITTSAAVMKMNTDLGYKPVTYSELPASESFWDGCKSCPNYEILQSKNRKMCMCTALLYLPKENRSNTEESLATGMDAKGLAALERLWSLRKKEQISSSKGSRKVIAH